jgi:signal transduction histidine kinase
MGARRWTAQDLVASGRLALAVFGLLAIYLDPLQPARYEHESYALLLGYLAFAGLALCCSLGPWPLRRHVAVAFFLVDLIVFAVLTYLTEGPTSPFFVFFSFSLIAAALQWGWRGAVGAAGAISLIFATVATFVPRLVAEPDDDLTSWIILRAVYFSVVAALLVAAGLAQTQQRRRLEQLAGWPLASHMEAQRDMRLDVAVRRCGRILQAPRLAVRWAHPGEALAVHAVVDGEEVRLSESGPPADCRLAVEPGDAGSSVCRMRGERFFLRRFGEDFRRIDRLPAPYDGLPPSPRRETTAAAVRLRGHSVEGWLVVLDPPESTDDYLLLCRLASDQLASRIEDYRLHRELEIAGVARERMRLARELHDGLLQTLGGINMSLRAIALRQPVGGELRGDLDEIQRLLRHEQSSVRAFVEGSRADQGEVRPLAVAAEIGAFWRRMARHWGCAVDLVTEPGDLVVHRELGRQLMLVLNEALANAVRHGGASRVQASIAAAAGELRVSVSDNGCGFPPPAEPGPAELGPAQLGLDRLPPLPDSLSRRLGALGGSLSVASSGAGTVLQATIPMAA